MYLKIRLPMLITLLSTASQFFLSLYISSDTPSISVSLSRFYCLTFKGGTYIFKSFCFLKQCQFLLMFENSFLFKLNKFLYLSLSINFFLTFSLNSFLSLLNRSHLPFSVLVSSSFQHKNLSHKLSPNTSLSIFPISLTWSHHSMGVLTFYQFFLSGTKSPLYLFFILSYYFFPYL